MSTLTRAGLIAEIQSDTDRTGTANATAIGLGIDRAIRHYQPRRFWFNETRSCTFNTVVGTDTYAFNTATTVGAIGYEFYTIDGLWVTFRAGDVRELDVEDYVGLEYDADNATSNNQPTSYAFIDRGIRFNCPPDAIYAVRIAGHIKLAGPATDAEPDNPWMTEAFDLIMCRTKAELYAHKWEDPGNAALMVQAEGSALRALQDATVDKLRTGYVHPSSDF